MIEKDNNNTLKAYTGPLSRTLREEYTIGEEYYRGDVKRGLRNSDGTGVLVGVSKVGSVQGYLIQDGQRIPAPGRTTAASTCMTSWAPTGKRERSAMRRSRICCSWGISPPGPSWITSRTS